MNPIGFRAGWRNANFKPRSVDRALEREGSIGTRHERPGRNHQRVRPHIQRHALSGRVNGRSSSAKSEGSVEYKSRRGDMKLRSKGGEGLRQSELEHGSTIPVAEVTVSATLRGGAEQAARRVHD